MKTYKEFRPTGFDGHIYLDKREDWLVAPFGRNRDSDCLDESNFVVGLESLGGESDTVEVHRFGHWACGWFEIVLVKPDTPAMTEAERIEGKLAHYPILDEYDLSEREQEVANLTWRNCYRPSERIKYIREHREQFEFSDFADMLACVRGKYFAGYASELLY
jgi:hypothetical protein